jgi:hypothetical protein
VTAAQNVILPLPFSLVSCGGTLVPPGELLEQIGAADAPMRCPPNSRADNGSALRSAAPWPAIE